MAGLVAGSHQHNELHIMHGHEEPKEKSSPYANARTCRVCGDEIGLRDDGELFVACHECGFPVCRPCYEYERSEGNQCCPQCNTRYKRHKGCPRVAGDADDGADMDDFEDEFQIKSPGRPQERVNRFEVYSENSEPMAAAAAAQQWRPGGPALSSFAGSVAGKDLEAERELEGNMEWKDRIEKWKAKQDKNGMIGKDDGENDEENNDDADDYML